MKKSETICQSCTLNFFCKHSMSNFAHPLLIKKKATIIKQGDTADTFFIIHSGSTKVTHQLGPEEPQVLAFQFNNDFSGLESLHSTEYTCNVTALEDTHICLFSANKFLTETQNSPTLAIALAKLISKEADKKTRQQLLIHSAEEKVVSLLKTLQKAYGSNPFTLTMSRKDIANYLNLTIETLSRTLNKLKAKKHISIQSRQIVTLEA